MNNNNNNNNSKEETGRDTPQLYSAIVGGEGQDFVATTLSTSAQVRRETERDHFFFLSDTTLLLLFNLFASSYFLYLFLFLLCDAKEIESAKIFSNRRLSPMFVLLFSNRSKRRCKKSNPRAR